MEPHSDLATYRLSRREDGAYSHRSEIGEEVLVTKRRDGSWDFYLAGAGEALGLWRNAPRLKQVERKGLLGLLGFKKTIRVPPGQEIEPSQVRRLYFLDNEVQGREIYRDVNLPALPSAKPWRPHHYDIYMRIDPRTRSVESRTKITGEALEHTRTVPIDFSDFPGSVSFISQAGEVHEFERTLSGVAVPIDLHPKQEFTLEIHFDGTPKPVSHPGVPADLGWLTCDWATVTFNGAANSSSWLPGDDNPASKATYDFLLEVPVGYFAVANGRLIEKRALQNDHLLFHYRCHFPMASYLASVNTFNEQKYTRTAVTEEFEVVHPRGIESRVRSEFRRHREMMTFLEKRLGPYPFECYGAIVTDLPVDSYRTRFTDGENTYEAYSKYEVAFEAQTRPIFEAESITGSGDFEPTIIHELAHQWFGNAVTNASESDVWVNEAFPSYCGYLWREHSSGDSSLFEQELKVLYESIAQHRFTDTMARPERDKLFSQENYARMTLSMHALRRELGDHSFYVTLRGAIERHLHKSIDVDTLVQTMNELNNQTLSGFFQRWLYSTELPSYPD